MRTDGPAFVPLGAKVLIVPYRDEIRDSAFFVLRCSGGEGAIHGERTDRQFIAPARGDLAEHLLHEGIGGPGHQRLEAPLIGIPFRVIHFLEVFQGGVHGLEVHLYHLVPFVGIRLDDGVLDPVNGLLLRQDP